MVIKSTSSNAETLMENQLSFFMEVQEVGEALR
jgi:hypothetical protein